MKTDVFLQYSREALGLLVRGSRARAEGPDQTRRLATQGLIQSSIPAAGSEEPTQATSTTWLVWRTTTVVELDADVEYPMSGRIPPSRPSRTESETAPTAAAPILESTGTAPARLPQALTSIEVAGHATLSAALALRRQAMLHSWVEDWDDAHDGLVRALALLEGGLEPRHPLIAATLYLVAEACRELGDEARAQAFSSRIRGVLSDWQPPHGPSRAQVLGWGLPNRRGRQPEVEICFWPARHMLEICRRSPLPASDLGLLAQFHHRRGWLGLAEILYWQSLDWGMTELGPHHPQVAADHLNLADLLRST